MMYPFLTLDDGTEIVHSEMLPDSRVKVYMERADEKLGFLWRGAQYESERRAKRN